MTGPATGTVPVGPMLSMYDPIHVGSDEFGQPFYIRLIYKNLLAAGEPGGGRGLGEDLGVAGHEGSNDFVQPVVHVAPDGLVSAPVRARFAPADVAREPRQAEAGTSSPPR